MIKRILVSLSLLMLTCCNSLNNTQYPPRPVFAGTTYGDVIAYTANLEILYDSCAATPRKGFFAF